MQFSGNNRKMWPQNWCITSRRNGKVWWFKQTKIPALTSKYTNRTERQRTKTRHLWLPPPPPPSLQGNLDSLQIRREGRANVTSLLSQYQHLEPWWGGSMKQTNTSNGMLQTKTKHRGVLILPHHTLSNDLAGLRGARVFYMACSTITGL